jgi:hypothetical protein
LTSLDFCGFSRQLVGFVGLLVVDEDVGRTCSLNPVFQDVLVLGVRKGLLKKRALDVTRFKSNFIGLKKSGGRKWAIEKV